MGFQRHFTVEGLNLERFLRAAVENGVTLHGLRRSGSRRITGVCAQGQLTTLEELAGRGGWRLTLGEHAGAGRIADRLRRRWLLGAALLATIAVMAAASQMVWHVSIAGAGTYEADIRSALAELGISLPAFRRSIDTGAIRDALEWRYPQVAWCECGLRGMSLEIRLVDGLAADRDAQDAGACDVVAARDGVVHSIVTRAGTPVVSAGDVVRAGDVLIRGEERTSGGAVRPVAARGSVYAPVWDSAAVKTPLRVTETSYTGRTDEISVVRTPWFRLWPAEESGFAHADISVREMPLGGFFWPVIWRSETHYEADLRSVLTDYRSVIAEGEAAALQKLHQIAGGEDSLVDNWVNWSIIEDEILLSVATGERLVDIAQQERSSGMAATE